MTQMPQMVALFNGVGGGAAALVALLELHEIVRARGVDVNWFVLAATAFTIAGRLRCRSRARSSPSPSSRS